MELYIRALLVWCGGLTLAVGLFAIWAARLEERIRERFAEDMRRALEGERLLK